MARVLDLEVAAVAGAVKQPEACLHLLNVAGLLGHELVEHRAVVLVDLLHLVDVAGHLLHGLQGLCGDESAGEGGEKIKKYNR